MTLISKTGAEELDIAVKPVEIKHCRAADGGRFWPLAPEKGGLTLPAAIHAISRIGRFNGHVRKPFYVAQHCVLVSRLAEKLAREKTLQGDVLAVGNQAGIEGLGHDLDEAAVGDMTTPCKAGFPDFKRLERDWERQLDGMFWTRKHSCNQPSLAAPLPWVKTADRVWLGVDRRDLVGEPDWWSDCTPEEAAIAATTPRQRCWGYARAEREWIARFEELTGRTLEKPTELWWPLLRLTDRLVGWVLG